VSALTTTPEPLSRDATDAECQALLERVLNSRELKRAQRLRGWKNSCVILWKANHRVRSVF
jgi:hypothetical protein